MNDSYAFLLNHLVQSTEFAIAAAFLAFFLRRNRAAVRFQVWLAASVKFLVPFSWVVNLGRHVKLPESAVPVVPVLQAAERFGKDFPFSTTTMFSPSSATHSSSSLSAIFLALWFCGAAVILFRWRAAWIRLYRLSAAASRVDVEFPIPVYASSAPIEPGVFGIIRPILLIPKALTECLDPVQIEAILAHELCHVRRFDNLTAAVHAATQALFWFHPGIWFIGSKLFEERELACDEAVIREGKSRESYAEGILRVCRLCLEPAGDCSAGVGGSDLRKRIEGILSGQLSARLGRFRIAAVAVAATITIIGPIGIGVLKSRAQDSGSHRLKFEVATIKTTDPNEQGVRYAVRPPGNLTVLNMTLRNLISSAYDVHQFQVVGGPKWLDTDHFDIEAKPGDALTPLDVGSSTEAQRQEFAKQLAIRLQSLLADRFGLVIRRETREMPVFALTVAKGGPKMKPVEEKRGQGGQVRGRNGIMTGTATFLSSLANNLAIRLERPVIDQTGLTGRYDWQFEWSPEQAAKSTIVPGGDRPAPSDISGPSIFTAVQEQLGLRLDPQRAPAPVIVVESASRPTAN